jgi:hypothetical protein
LRARRAAATSFGSSFSAAAGSAGLAVALLLGGLPGLAAGAAVAVAAERVGAALRQ